MRLTKAQLVTAKMLARDVPAGLYSLKELYGEHWQWVVRKRAYGRWFRLSVLDDGLPGVRWVRKRSNKSHEYEVVPSAMEPPPPMTGPKPLWRPWRLGRRRNPVVKLSPMQQCAGFFFVG